MRQTYVVLGCLAALVGCVSRQHEAGVAAHHDDATARHSFADVEHWTAVFDDRRRDEWQKPAALIGALDLRAGQSVADLGAGTGYFSRYLAEAVGAEGTVFAVDSEPNLVAYLRARAEREHLANVIPVLATVDDPRLPDHGIDLVLIVDTFHHIDGRVGYLRRLRFCLREGGRIVVVDWKKEELPLGPPLEHRLAGEQVVEEFNTAGFVLVSAPTLLPYQYVLVFEPR